MADLPGHPKDATAQADDKKLLPSKKPLAKAERAAKKERAKAERAALRAEAKEEKKQSKSLAKMAEAKILKDLSSSLETHARSATFACGGTVFFKSAIDETAEETSKESAQQEDDATDNPEVKAKAKDSEQPSATIDDVQVRFGPSGKGYTVAKATQSSSTKVARLGKTSRISSWRVSRLPLAGPARQSLMRSIA
jgi:hypothetical protein